VPPATVLYYIVTPLPNSEPDLQTQLFAKITATGVTVYGTSSTNSGDGIQEALAVAATDAGVDIGL